MGDQSIADEANDGPARDVIRPVTAPGGGQFGAHDVGEHASHPGHHNATSLLPECAIKLVVFVDVLEQGAAEPQRAGVQIFRSLLRGALVVQQVFSQRVEAADEQSLLASVVRVKGRPANVGVREDVAHRDGLVTFLQSEFEQRMVERLLGAPDAAVLLGRVRHGEGDTGIFQRVVPNRTFGGPSSLTVANRGSGWAPIMNNRIPSYQSIFPAPRTGSNSSVETESSAALRPRAPSPGGGRPLIELRDVVKAFGIADRQEIALRGVSLGVRTGEFVGVVGKSGSGKSTLLNMIAGIDLPSSGGITVAGIRIDQLNEEARAAWRGLNVGIVFQFFQLMPTLSVIENVMLPMDFCGTFPGAGRRQRAEALLELVGIPEQADKLPSSLSGGQQQRAAVARALANDPPLIVADEPTGNLDSATAQSVVALFTRLVEQGKTVVVVTHERDVENYVDRVVTLRDGRVEAESPGALKLIRQGGNRP